jgi:hypothetical protein
MNLATEGLPMDAYLNEEALRLTIQTGGVRCSNRASGTSCHGGTKVASTALCLLVQALKSL